MSLFAYNPKLNCPSQWYGINFADAKLKRSMDIIVRGLNEKTLAFAPCEGVGVYMKTFVSEDGAKIPCFVFEPGDKSAIRANMLYCHGGGFFLPLQPMMMNLACGFAEKLGIRVFLPQYRLLPEYPNPSAFFDCLAVLDEVARQDLPYLLYGESVGGTLAAGLALFSGDNGLKKANGQCLIYPVLDNAFGRYPSMRRFSEAAWPLRNHLIMWSEYLKPAMKIDAGYLIPMKAPSLASLPRTYIEPQEIDIVRDEAVEFAGRLEKERVPVTLNLVEGSYHGFDEDLGNPFVRDIVAKRIEFMKNMLI